MSKLIIVRGAPGTGKSTISKKIENRSIANSDMLVGQITAFHETDQFWTDELGSYHFDLSKLKSAHQWNQLAAERSMLHGVPIVIVANTFINHWEVNPYIDMANEYKYEVEIIRTPGPWSADVLFARNLHNVPLDVIKRHIRNYQEYSDETEWSDLTIFNESARPQE